MLIFIGGQIEDIKLIHSAVVIYFRQFPQISGDFRVIFSFYCHAAFQINGGNQVFIFHILTYKLPFVDIISLILVSFMVASSNALPKALNSPSII